MKQKLLLLFFIHSILYFAQAPKEYAQQIIGKLTSPEFSGRGYVDDGMKKAAAAVAEEFQKIGVNKLKDSYFQEFSYPVNVIKTCDLKINGKPLKIGYDYLVGAGSPSLKGTYKPLTFKSSVIDSLFENDDREPFDSELTRVNNHALVFPNAQFSESLIIEETTAQQFYHQIPELMGQGNWDLNVPLLVDQTSTKFIHSISPKQTKSVNLFVSTQAVPDSIKTIDIDLHSDFVPDFKAQNVIGYIKGKRSDSLIVLTAHYDHLGKINQTIFPGANDNASGVAFLLSMAKVYAKQKPRFDMVFIAFGGEEAGLRGSRYFANNPWFDLKKVKFLINFDMVGTGEEGIQVVNGKVYPKQFNKLEAISYNYAYLKQVKTRGESCNSDHCPFYEKGVPSFFVYTLGGKSGYHDVYDNQVSLFSFNKLVALFNKFIDLL